jgi:predicted AAA+ superfamily ATPase
LARSLDKSAQLAYSGIMATHIGQRTQELAHLNPWWRDAKGWENSDPDLVAVRQSGIDYSPDSLANLEDGSLYTLRGPRRVGKTVCVKQCIASLIAEGVSPSRIIRLAVDGWKATELRTVVQNIPLPPLQDGQHRFWFIDEISSVTGDWDKQIKWLRDNDTHFNSSTVVLTGSNAEALTEATGTLAGRRGKALNLDRWLLPMGFKTYAHTIMPAKIPKAHLSNNTMGQLFLSDLHTAQAAEQYASLVPWLDTLVSIWELYLLYGGFPRMVASIKRGEMGDAPFVNDLFEVVAGDVFKNSRLTSFVETQLLERLWGSLATPTNLNSIAGALDISKDTVKRHIEYLRDAFLLWYCPQKQSDSWQPRKGAQDKLYAIDPVIARLAYLRNSTTSDIDITALSEMQIGLAVRRRIASNSPSASTDMPLYYLRNGAANEIDFVSTYLEPCAIESKYTESGRWLSESRALAASEFDGIVATRNVLDTSGADNAPWAVPTAILAYLLDT